MSNVTQLKIERWLAADAKLKDAKIPIKYVKEMGTWSQPWFIPRRDDPKDDLFEFYFHEGDIYKATTEQERKELGIKDVSIVHHTTVERIRQIQAGEVLHDNLIALSWGFLKDGMHPTVVQATIEGIMHGCQVKDERWQSRFQDIPRYISDAIPKQEEEKINIDELEYDEDDDAWMITDIPWPPGVLGKLADDALSMQLHEYKEVAVVSAIGLVAGIAGRKFNVSRTGLNVYITLIMRTGMGKDAINEFIESTLIGLSEVGSSLSFLGTGRFTGPSAVYADLKSARSQICVFSEAGLLLRSKVGDTDGLTRAFLSMYTVSGKNRISKKETFTKMENTIIPLRAPALSIINEATPETLLGAFRDTGSLENGLLPRQSIFRVSRRKPYQKVPQIGLSNICIDRLSKLVKTCSPVQAADNPEAWDMEFEEGIKQDIKDHANFYVDEYNHFIDSNATKAIMSSRLHVKALKFAAIASVLNHTDAIIRKTEWEWAKELTAFEYSGIDNFFSGGTMNNRMHELSMKVVGRTIIKVLKNKFSEKKQMDIRYRTSGIVSLYVLNQALSSNQELNAISDNIEERSNPRDGLTKVLSYMVSQGYLCKIDDPYGKKANLYQITSLFKELMKVIRAKDIRKL